MARGSSRSEYWMMWCPGRWGRWVNSRHCSAAQRRQKRNILGQARYTIVAHWLACGNCQVRNWQSRSIVSHGWGHIRERSWPSSWWSRDSLCHWFLCISIIAAFLTVQPLVMFGHGKRRGKRSRVMICRPVLVVRIRARAWRIRDARGRGRSLHRRRW
jgi:hypothetical protein